MVKPKQGEASRRKAEPKDIKAGQKSENKMETSATPTVTIADERTAGHAVMKGLKILVGIIIGLIGLFLLWYFWGEFALIFKGLIGPVVMLVGLVVVILGWTD